MLEKETCEGMVRALVELSKSAEVVVPAEICRALEKVRSKIVQIHCRGPHRGNPRTQPKCTVRGFASTMGFPKRL